MIPKLEIIIVNWNSGELLSECIHSIGNAVGNNFKLNKVVVVDNASIDNSLDNLIDADLPLEIIRNSQNLGFARACNLGAGESRADYLLFLNPDTKLFSDSLSLPVNFLEKEENQGIGILGVKLLDENSNANKNCARFPSAFNMSYMSFGLDRLFPKIFKPHFMFEWDHLSSREVDQVMGSFLLIRRELFQSLGGYDERFFVYYEDLDLSFRAKQRGAQSYYLADAVIYHKGGGTTENVKAMRLFYLLRSKLLFARKHFTAAGYYPVLIFTFIPEFLIRIAALLATGKIKACGEVASAYSMLIRSLFK